MITGHGGERTASDAFRFGVTGYVVKDPRQHETLIDALRNALSDGELSDADS